MDQIFCHKMQGAGNDFIVLDHLQNPALAQLDHARFAALLCDRHFGVGADGLLTLEAPDSEYLAAGAHVRMRMWNPDGSEDMCGNGLRCVAALAHDRGHVSGSEFSVQTLSGQRTIQVLDNRTIRANMGKPLLRPEQAPMLPPDARENALDYDLPVDGRVFSTASTLSTGSTHTAIFLDEMIAEGDFQRLSPLLEHHPWFPERTTVLWTVQDGTGRFRVRIWERGVGETLACGTGASAVAVAAIATGRAQGPVAIESRGGILLVEWTPGESIHLTGPAEILFQGKWLISDSNMKRAGESDATRMMSCI